jgi:hypothetical protein
MLQLKKHQNRKGSQAESSNLTRTPHGTCITLPNFANQQCHVQGTSTRDTQHWQQLTNYGLPTAQPVLERCTVLATRHCSSSSSYQYGNTDIYSGPKWYYMVVAPPNTWGSAHINTRMTFLAKVHSCQSWLNQGKIVRKALKTASSKTHNILESLQSLPSTQLLLFVFTAARSAVRSGTPHQMVFPKVSNVFGALNEYSPYYPRLVYLPHMNKLIYGQYTIDLDVFCSRCFRIAVQFID